MTTPEQIKKEQASLEKAKLLIETTMARAENPAMMLKMATRELTASSLMPEAIAEHLTQTIQETATLLTNLTEMAATNLLLQVNRQLALLGRMEANLDSSRLDLTSNGQDQTPREDPELPGTT